MASTLKLTDIAYPGSANTAITINADDSVSMNGGVVSPQTGFKNRIINGGMTIDQRNAGASVTPINGQYLVDRFYALVTAASKFTAQQDVGLNNFFTNSLKMTSSSAYSVAAGDVFTIIQKIEGANVSDLGWGTANAQPVTLSFIVNSSLTGTFGGSIMNASLNRSYPFTFSISTASTATSISVTIPGDTTGTWGTGSGTGILLSFSIGTGTTFSGTAGAWGASEKYSATGATSVVGTSGATFYITGVQLEKGSTATPFEFRSYGTELGLCQRYAVAFTSGTTAAAYGGLYSTTAGRVWYRMPVTMRAAPTLSTTTTAFELVGSGSITGTINSAFFSTNYATFDGVSLSSAGAVGQPLVYAGTGILSAEL
jgi:hypothetical protein